MGWFTNDLTAATNAPPVAQGIAGYVFDTQNTQHVNYRGTDRHIYELYWDGSWQVSDLTQASDALKSVGLGALAVGKPHGYAFEAQNTQHVVYRGSDNSLYEGHDNRIHELWWDGGWHCHDLTQASGAVDGGLALAAGEPYGYVFNAEGTQHVNYRGADSHIYEMWWDGSWHAQDLSHAAGANMPAAGDPHGYVFDAQHTQHVVYRGTDGHIYELYWDGSWQVSDLTQTSDALKSVGLGALAAGDPRGYVFDAQNTQHVVYRGTDNHIYELWWDGNWHVKDVMKEAGATPSSNDPAGGYVFGAEGTQHIDYVMDSDGSVCELWWDGQWHLNNLSTTAKAPASDGALCAYMFRAEGTQHVVYVTALYGDGPHVYELYWTGPSSSSVHWHADITFPDGVPVGGWSDLVLNQDGSAQLSGHFHDSGFPSYKTAAAWVVTDDFGNVYTFGAQGSVQGTEAGFSPNRDWNYNAPGWNAGITQAWNQLRDARPTWKAQANVDVGALIQDIIQGIGEVQTVIAVIALA